MIIKTRKGIFNNLKLSDYKFKIDELELFFSSEFYRKKFYETYRDNRSVLKDSLVNRWGIKVELDTLYDIVHYSKIEKRGFYIKLKGVEYECLESVTLNFENKINQKSAVQLESLTVK